MKTMLGIFAMLLLCAFLPSTCAIDPPMPVELASFTADATAGGVLLQWVTVSERNNYGFFVERDTIELSGVFIPGHGTSNERHEYTYTDHPSGGRHGYRLRQVDIDGTSHLSDRVTVNCIWNDQGMTATVTP